MTVIFKAKTHEGYTIKILSELLQNIIKTACLHVHRNGISLRMMDSHRRILIDIELVHTNFNIYHMEHPDTPMFLGINLNHFYRMLKSIKKKDALMMTIDDTEPDHLMLIVYPKENNRVATSSVHIQSIQHVSIMLPTGYVNPVMIPSCEYQRTLKDMNNIGDVVTVSMRQYSITLLCSAENIYSREVLFGELTDDTDEHYREDFDMEQFTRILKLSGLSKTIQVYSGNEHTPLLLKSRVGQLGDISIYIKSKRQLRGS